MEKADGNIEILKSGNEKYSFGNLFKFFIKQQKLNNKASYVDKIKQRCEKYLLPSLKNRDVKDIKHSDLYAILKPLYNENAIAESLPNKLKPRDQIRNNTSIDWSFTTNF